jgi:hypothetical protein
MSSQDRRIRLVQCLCPSQHCICALAFDPADLDDQGAIGRLKDTISKAIAGGQIDPWCALCLSRHWHYEVGVTRFYSLQEATPHLRKSQAEQLLTQAYLFSGREG